MNKRILQTAIPNYLLLALCCFALMLLFGCNLQVPASEKFTNGSMTLARFGNASITDPNDPNSLICQELNDPKPCYCMFCQSYTTWFGNIWRIATLSLFYDDTLREGTCSFDPCNLTDMQSEIQNEGDKQQIRTMMVGAGPSFISTDSGNRYCNYSLQIATRWMKGNEFELPRIPIKVRAECWLDHNTLPLYMYYTNGKNIDAGRTGEIADALHTAGPVLIATEVALNSSNDNQIAEVKGQIDAIRSNCPYCLTVLSVYGNKTERELALEKILKDPANPNGFSQYYDKVDMIGFGFLANDYPTCSPAEVIGENYIFSRFVLKNYSKPTIWLYAGASVGNNTLHTCYWNEEKVHNFYQIIFATSQAMASSGVIGVSFYEFVDYTGPLPCNSTKQGCAYGLVDKNGDQKHPQLNTWSSMCQYFGVMQHRSPLIFSRNGYGSVCGPLQMENNRMFKATSMEFNTNLGLAYTEVDPMPKEDWLQCGEICVSDTEMARPEIYDNIHHQLSGEGDPCTDYQEIEELSDEAEFSSLYMRSVISQESQFNPWIVSCSSGPCGKTSTYATLGDLCEAAHYPRDCDAETLFGKTCPRSEPYFCAIGLAQCINAPGDVSSDTKGCRGEDNFYDPFNPRENVCCGINKMTAGLASAQIWVKQHDAELSACAGEGGYEPGEFGWLTYYLASLEYYIGPSAPYKNFLNEFVNQRDRDGPCTGTYKDFITYLQKTKGCTRDPDCYSYPAHVMSRYLDGTSRCDSDCPGKLVPSPP